MIKIINKSFDLENEFKRLNSSENGAYSFFLGTVRSEISSLNKNIKGIFLECYEELAYTQLDNIRNIALKKWKLSECLIIHRIGKLNLGEKIVLIITSCEFVIDSMKIDVEFWKFHLLDNGEKEIVPQKKKDKEKILKWREIIN